MHYKKGIQVDKKMKILYFAPIYFDDMKQRPQQIAELLAQDYIVYYVEPTISLMRQIIKGGMKCTGKKDKITEQLQVIRLNGCCTLHKSLEIYDILGANNISEVLQLRNLVKDCDIIWVGYSGWYTVVRHFMNKIIIFDKMDEEDLLASSKSLKYTLKRNMRKMVEISDYMVVTCQKFYQEIKGLGKPVELIPNGVSAGFTKRTKDNLISYAPITILKRIGYIGTISEWFDYDVINTILETNQVCEIILVGRNHLPELHNPRIKYVGIKKNEELPDIIKTFDLCLYNFKDMPLLDTINPVKIYEYLSLNIPVLAVKSMETIILKDYLMLYENMNDVILALKGNVKRPFIDEEARLSFINNNSWDARVKQINKILDTLEA